MSKMKKLDKSRIIFLCAVLINLQTGLSFCWSVYLKELVEVEGWSHGDAVLPSTVMTVSFSLAMLLFGLFQEKYGPRLTIWAGSLLMGAGLFLAAQSVTAAGITVGFGILHGSGIAACFSTTQSTALKWIPAGRQGRTIGVISAACGLSSVVLVWVSEVLLRTGGIVFAFRILGAFIMTGTFLAGCFMRLPKAGELEETAPAEKKSGEETVSEQEILPGGDMNRHQMLRTRMFYYVLGFYLLGCASTQVPMNHISVIASLQAGLENGAMFVSVISVCNFLGRLAGGWLGDRYSERAVLSTAAAVNMVNLLCFGMYRSMVPLLLGCIINGLHLGMMMAQMPVIVSKLFGKTYCAQNYGVMACFGLLNGILGSQVSGYFVDTFHSYRYAYLLCVVYLAITVVLTRKLPKKMK